MPLSLLFALPLVGSGGGLFSPSEVSTSGYATPPETESDDGEEVSGLLGPKSLRLDHSLMQVIKVR